MFKIKGFKPKNHNEHSDDSHDRNYDVDDCDYVHDELEKKALKKDLKKMITHKNQNRQDGRFMRMTF